MVSGGGIWGMWLGHEGAVLMTEISSTLLKKKPESSLAPSAMWEHSGKKEFCEPEIGLTPNEPASWTSNL